MLQIGKPEVIHQPFSQSQNDCVVEKFPAETNFSWFFKTSFKLVSDTYIPNRTFFIYSDFKFNSRLFYIWHGGREQLLHGDAWPQGSAIPGAGGDNDGADATYYNSFKAGVWQIRKAKKL